MFAVITYFNDNGKNSKCFVYLNLDHCSVLFERYVKADAHFGEARRGEANRRN